MASDSLNFFPANISMFLLQSLQMIHESFACQSFMYVLIRQSFSYQTFALCMQSDMYIMHNRIFSNCMAI